jgi:hypothetical protein
MSQLHILSYCDSSNECSGSLSLLSIERSTILFMCYVLSSESFMVVVTHSSRQKFPGQYPL